tara:strand:+ start:682 stop:993 length:312 start_codon:yes stop_codon:yes gene_type:complete
MVIYKVIIHIQKNIEKEWISWMKKEHIPEIMALNIFKNSKLFKILNVRNLNFKSYCIEYHCESIDDYNNYQKNHAKKIQKKHSKKYEGLFTAERLILSFQNGF